MLSLMLCLANAKCSDVNDVSNNSTSTPVNKILNTSSINSTSTLVNKLLSTGSNNSTTITPDNNNNNKITTPRCLCNSASRL